MPWKTTPITSSTAAAVVSSTQGDCQRGRSGPRRSQLRQVLRLHLLGASGERGAEPRLDVRQLGRHVRGAHRSSFPELVCGFFAIAFSSATSPRLAVDFTVPWLMSSVRAISASLRFDQ